MPELVETYLHGELEAALPDYRGILAFLEGSSSARAGYLLRYESEDDKTEEAKQHFATRLARLYVKPIMEPAHQIHLAHLGQKITWGSIRGSALEALLDDVSGEQQTADEFAHDLLWYRLALGRVGVLVDGPKKDGSIPESARQAAVGGDRAFHLLYRADQILFWRFAKAGPRRGKLIEVLLTEEPEYTTDGKVLQRRRRMFYPNPFSETAGYRWQLLRELTGEQKAVLQNAGVPMEAYSGKFEIVDQGEGALSEIPFVMWGRGLRDSIDRMIWPLEAAAMNANSNKNNIIFKQGFQRIIVAGAKSHELAKIGEAIINKLENENAKVHTVEAGNPDASFKEESLLETRAQRMALLQHNQLVDDTRQVQSAESKEKDLKAREQFYCKILDQAQRILNKVWRLTFELEGVEGGDKIQVSFARDFGLRDDNTEMAVRNSISAQARALGATSVQKEILKTDVSKLNFVVTGEETEAALKERLYKEIDAVSNAEPATPTTGLSSDQRPGIGAAFRPQANGDAE